MARNLRELDAYACELQDACNALRREMMKLSALRITRCWKVVIVGYSGCMLSEAMERLLRQFDIIPIYFVIEELPILLQYELIKLTHSPKFPKMWVEGKYQGNLIQVKPAEDEHPDTICMEFENQEDS